MATGRVTVETTVHAQVDKAWEYWTEPAHITQWNNASDDWHTPTADNDLRAGGKFLTRMEAKDGSFGFDFSGVYDEVRLNELISYTLGDGRKVEITFINQGNETKIIESFDPESENPIDLQKSGWQSIMDNFKKYIENSI